MADGSGHAPRRRGVLLDVDGTLLLSNDAHAETWAAALRESGRDVPAARVRPLVGMGGDKLLPALGVDVDEDEANRLARRKKELFTAQLGALRPAPGARALLERLHADGYVLVVATSADDEELQGLLRQAGIADLLDGRTTSSDVAHSKPDPDVVATAAARSGLPPAALVMLGDTPYDVAAARSAGVAAVGVRCGGWDDAALAGAAAVYDDPAHLLRELHRSPLVAPVAAGR